MRRLGRATGLVCGETWGDLHGLESDPARRTIVVHVGENKVLPSIKGSRGQSSAGLILALAKSAMSTVRSTTGLTITIRCSSRSG
jgi:hypothetical protein